MFCRSVFVLFLLVIVLIVLQFTASDFHFDIFFIIAIALFVLLRFTVSDYQFGIFKLVWSISILAVKLMLIMLYLFHIKLQDFCESQKGILVRIESWDENDWIRKQMKTGKDMCLTNYFSCKNKLCYLCVCYKWLAYLLHSLFLIKIILNLKRSPSIFGEKYMCTW